MADISNTLPSGTLLRGGTYRIVRFIKSGGFGCTYEALHTGLNKRVAIKEFFHKDFCERDSGSTLVTLSSKNQRERVDELKRKFMEEAQAIAQLEHPGVVGVQDVFEENGTAYYVMTYIDGTDLDRMVRTHGAMPEQTALGYICQVGEALAFVHQHKRLHLDVKPGNIMLDAGGRAILIDFGVSKQYRDEDGANSSLLLGKTPAYSPPEQYSGDVRQFLPATDVYALGATLYKLLSGVTPPTSTARSSGEELDALPAYVSSATRKAVLAAMSLNKRERPQSMQAFLHLLPDGKGAQQTTEEEATEVVEVIGVEPAKPKPQPQKPQPEDRPDSSPSPQSPPKPRTGLDKWVIGVAVVGLFVALVVGVSTGGDSSQGTQTIDVDSSVSSSPSSSTSISSGDGTLNGHAYVDLGLSVKWATCNVGASSPEQYGNYYAWGETSTKSEYASTNSKTYGKSSYNFDIGGNSSLDAARANWGGTWRLPTADECQELLDECTWTWTTLGGKNGYRVTGPSGKSIFLPAAGDRNGSALDSAGESGYYWTSTPHGDYAYSAQYLGFLSSDRFVDWYGRYYGFSVRPVSE